MLEDFLKDIYDKALTLQLMKEASFYSNIRHPDNRRNYWNEAALYLDKILDDLKATNPKKCVELYESSKKAQSKYIDRREFAAVIDSEVVPQVHEYLKKYIGIEVTEGKWTIKSSATGFLTIRNKNGLYLHSSYDPMWESFLYAYSIYKPGIRMYKILGGGLGYLGYCLWRLSEGEADIYIYETDEEIASYSDLYGVTSLIDENRIHIITGDDKDIIIEQYLERLGDSEIVRTIHCFDYDGYNGEYNNLVRTLQTNEITSRVFETKWHSNYSWNVSYEHKSISEFDTTALKDDWVIVASGPSLNDNEDFIRESVGKRTICAVNSSLKWFYLHNIKPDLCVVCDPSDELKEHIEGFEDFSIDVPIVADCIASQKYLEIYKGPRYYVVSCAGYDIADSNNKPAQLWTFGGTVTSMAFEAANKLGAKKIYMIGADLGYPDGKGFATGVSHEAFKWNRNEETVVSVEDTIIQTSYIFNEYRDRIERQIAERPDIEVVNKSLHGAYLKGTYCGKWWENIPETGALSQYIDYFGELKKDSLILGWNEKYYIFWQLIKRLEDNETIIDYKTNKIIEESYKTIYELFKRDVDLGALSLEGAKSAQTYVFSAEYMDEKEPNTRNVLNVAKSEVKKKRNVLIVNTAEQMGGTAVPIHSYAEKRYNDKLENLERVIYENKSYPFFQFPKGMPDIKHFNMFLNSVAKSYPDKIIIMNKYSLLADACSELFGVETERKY